MKYPYIAESKINKGEVALFVSKENAIALTSNFDMIRKFESCGSCDESLFKNITREYLEGKCVKIESPEHGEFVAELCKNNSIGPDKHDNKPWAYIEGGELYFTSIVEETDGGDNFEEATIPLPPKDIGATKTNDWPQVGSSVGWDDDVYTGNVICIYDGFAWVHGDDDTRYTKPLKSLSKPKTEAEILRDELIEYLNELGSSARYCFGGNELAADELLKEYNITKKPQ